MGTVLSAVARSTRQGEYQYRAIRCGRVYIGTVLSAVARSTRQGEYQYRAIRCGRVYIGTVLSAVVHTRTPPLMFRTAN